MRGQRVGAAAAVLCLLLTGPAAHGQARDRAAAAVVLEILHNGELLKMFVAMTERQDPFGGLSPATDPREQLQRRGELMYLAFSVE